MVNVPVRDARAGFAAIENETVPWPIPLAPAVIVIQLALLVAVRLQVLAEAVTPTLIAATPDPTDALVVDKEKVHEGGAGDEPPLPLVAPAWLTVNVLPATVSVPVRE